MAERSNGAFPGERFASVPPGTFGPYLATRPDGMIAAWAAAEDGKRHWFTAALGPSGKPLGAPLAVADAAPEVNLVAVRPAGAAGSGFFLLTTSREFSGERIDVLGLGTHGELRGGPTPLSLSLPDVVWIDVVPTKRGATAMWAVRREDRADLYGVRLGETGGPEDRSSEVLRDVRAWQVAETPEGIALVAALAGKEVGERGPLVLCLLGAEVQVEKKILLSDGNTVEPDVDLAKLGERLLVAWSDKANVDPRITGAVVDLAGNIVVPKRPIVPSFGPQALVRLVAPRRDGTPAYVAWENALEKPRTGRTLRIGAVSRDLAFGQATAMVSAVNEGSLPELAVTEKGLAVLTTGPMCERGLLCPDAPGVPTFGEIDMAIKVVTSEPIRLRSLHGKVVDLAWGLSCAEGGCLALAAAPSNPAPVYVVKLGNTTNGRWESAVKASADVPPPRPDEVEAVAKTENVAGMATARIGSGQVISWVTYLDPATPFARIKKAAPDGKLEAPRALLRIQSVPDKGPPAEPVTLSYRGHSPGGVAMAPGEPGREEALLVWAGIDDRQTQVFLTLLGPGGRKISQRMLTHGKGSVSYVAAASTGDGWAIAWVDEHGGSAQIHLAKVDRKLSPIVHERPLLSSRSAQASVKVLSRSDHLFVVWSDGRGGASGNSDIFALRLSSKDLAAVGPEHAIATTALRSRSPAIDAFGEGAAVAWIEDAKAGSDAAGSTIFVARLDSGAEIIDTPATVPVEGWAEGVGIACGKAECRIATSVFAGEEGDVEALEWAPGAAPRATRLLPLGARLHQTAIPIFIGQDLLYADERRAGDARLRRVRVTWR